MAKYNEIARVIEAEILAGEHGTTGDRFATVRDLAERFSVALTTAQKVVSRLKQRGLLTGNATSRTRIAADTAARRSPRRLGLVVTDITNPFFSRVCRHIQRAASDEGYQVLVASSESVFARERKLIEGFLDIGVEGLLICPGLDEACTRLYRELIERGVRLSFVSRRVEGVEADFVVAHSFVGGASVAGHLLSIGYESFGYLGFGPRLKRDERLHGFRSALVEEGLELGADRIANGDGRGIEHGYRAMSRLMQRKDRPRAVFAFNDLLAIGAMRYCQEHSIDVPGDVAVAGFDNLPESRVTSPPLTTVAYPVEAIARLAVQNVVDRIRRNDDRPPNRVLLEPHLVVRQSTDPAAGESRPAIDPEDEAVEKT